MLHGTSRFDTNGSTRYELEDEIFVDEPGGLSDEDAAFSGEGVSLDPEGRAGVKIPK